MVTTRSIEQAVSPRQALVAVASTGLAAAAIGSVYLATGLGIPCPFRALTGWLCPFCGGTHMAAALLRGDIAGAWSANPLALVVGFLMGVRTVGWLGELVRHPHAPSHRWLPASWSRHWVAAFVGVSVVYVLVRNLLSWG